MTQVPGTYRLTGTKRDRQQACEQERQAGREVWPQGRGEQVPTDDMTRLVRASVTRRVSPAEPSGAGYAASTHRRVRRRRPVSRRPDPAAPRGVEAVADGIHAHPRRPPCPVRGASAGVSGHVYGVVAVNGSPQQDVGDTRLAPCPAATPRRPRRPDRLDAIEHHRPARDDDHDQPVDERPDARR